jgi:hypothetical protein
VTFYLLSDTSGPRKKKEVQKMHRVIIDIAGLEESVYGRFVREVWQNFDRPEWSAKRVEFLRFACAITAWPCVEEEVEHILHLDQLDLNVIPRRAIQLYFVHLGLFAQYICQIRPANLRGQELVQDKRVQYLRTRWAGTPALVEGLQKSIDAARNSLDWFNLQIANNYAMGVVTRRRIGTFECLVVPSEDDGHKDWYGPIENLAFGRGRSWASVFAGHYAKLLEVCEVQLPEFYELLYLPEVDVCRCAVTGGYAGFDAERVAIELDQKPRPALWQPPLPEGVQQLSSGLLLAK